MTSTILVPELLFWSKGFIFAGKGFTSADRLSTRSQAGGKTSWLAMTQISKLPTLLPTDSDAVYVVTGGNRGLGLEHVRQFLEKSDAHVVATTTKDPPSEAHNLKLLKDQGKGHRLTVVTLNLSDESSIKVGLERHKLSRLRSSISALLCCRLLLTQ